MADPATVAAQRQSDQATAHAKPSLPPSPQLASISVVLLMPLSDPAGGHWAAGECAGFPPDMAKDLIARGVARADDRPPRKSDGRTLDSPPADKMVRGGDAQRKSEPAETARTTRKEG